MFKFLLIGLLCLKVLCSDESFLTDSNIVLRTITTSDKTIRTKSTKTTTSNTITSTTTTSSTATTTTTESTTTTPAEIPPGATELNCIFPFIYNGNWTDKCLESKENPNTFWCSLDKVFTNRLVPCEQACPLLARQIMAKSSSQTHTTCLDPNPQASSLFPTSEQIDVILAEHDRVRSEVNDPPAADMRVVFWDYGLARLAQRWAENCVFDHDCFECRALLNNQSVPVGQNAYAYFGSDYNPKTFWFDVIKLWADEKVNFKYDVGATTGNFGDIGHYTQLISSDMSRVGCGAALCGSSIYAYCNYANGQSDVNRPYTSGSSCSMCSSSNCKMNLCQCDAFCQNSGTLDLAKCECNCQANFSGAQCEIKKEPVK